MDPISSVTEYAEGEDDDVEADFDSDEALSAKF